jgi:hypothetical protein
MTISSRSPNSLTENTLQVAADAASKAEKASNKAVKTSKEVLKRIELLEKRIRDLEESVPKENIIVIREISRDEAKTEIKKLFEKGKVLYYSDIVEQLSLDLELVVDICNQLRKLGEIEIDASIS